MTHLSKEHYHATAPMATPKSTPTHGGLRDIFKPSHSIGSSAPNTLMKPPTTAIEADNVISSDFESIQAPFQKPADVADGDVKHAAEIGNGMSGEAQEAYAGFSGVQPAFGLAAQQTHTNDEIFEKEEVESIRALSVSTPVRGNPLTDLNAGSRQRSFASNILDDQDSLRTGIRDITAKFELNNGGGMSRSSCFKRISTNTNILHGSKHVGPFVLRYSPNTYKLQKSIVSVHILAILFSAFVGPKAFVTTIWRFAIALLTYFATGNMLGWPKDARTDILLSSVLHIAGLMHNFFCDAIDQYVIFKVYLNSQIVRESLAEVRAVFDHK